MSDTVALHFLTRSPPPNFASCRTIPLRCRVFSLTRRIFIQRNQSLLFDQQFNLHSNLTSTAASTASSITTIFSSTPRQLPPAIPSNATPIQAGHAVREMIRSLSPTLRMLQSQSTPPSHSPSGLSCSASSARPPQPDPAQGPPSQATPAHAQPVNPPSVHTHSAIATHPYHHIHTNFIVHIAHDQAFVFRLFFTEL